MLQWFPRKVSRFFSFVVKRKDTLQASFLGHTGNILGMLFFFNLSPPHTLFCFIMYMWWGHFLYIHVWSLVVVIGCLLTLLSPLFFLSWVIALALELAVLDNFSDLSHPCLCTPQPRAFRHVPTRPWLLPEHWGLSTSHHYTPSREPTELFPLPWTNIF